MINGSIDKSYGINVASLAKLPKEVIDRANEILSVYENKKDNKKNNYQQTSFDFVEEEQKESIEDEIKEIDPLNLTPIEALNKLYELVNKVKEKE